MLLCTRIENVFSTDLLLSQTTDCSLAVWTSMHPAPGSQTQVLTDRNRVCGTMGKHENRTTQRNALKGIISVDRVYSDPDATRVELFEAAKVAHLEISDCLVAHIQTAPPQAGRGEERENVSNQDHTSGSRAIIKPYLARKFSMVVVA